MDVSLLKSNDPDHQEWEEERASNVERWGRAMMGLKPSPFFAIQQMMWAKESIVGDKDDPNNPFRWDRVELNLPCTKGYDPKRPWVSKVRGDGVIASDVFLYADDVRHTGDTEEDCWRGARRFMSMCNYLGIQDAPRKRKAPDQDQGPWAGTEVHTSTGLEGMLPEGKWTKLKQQIERLAEMHAEDPDNMDRKELESMRGFMIYCCRTYRNMNPYLKGVHLTIDSWRDYRDNEGWKLRGKALADARARVEAGEVRLREEGQKGQGGEALVAIAEGKWFDHERPEGPGEVAAVPRLAKDIEALQRLTASDRAPS